MEGFMDFIQQKLADDFLYSDDEVMESLLKCLKRLQVILSFYLLDFRKFCKRK